MIESVLYRNQKITEKIVKIFVLLGQLFITLFV